MHIEQKNKNLLGSKKTNLSNTKNGIEKLRIWVSLYRLDWRNKINLNNVSFSAFLTLAPFALGFTNFLIHYISSSQDKSFFQLNLPVFKSFKPKLHLETIEYILKSDDLSELKLNTVQQTFLEKGINNFEKSFLFGQSQYLGKINKEGGFLQPSSLPEREQISRRTFTGLNCDFYLLSSGNFLPKNSSTNISVRELDELPSYLKGFAETATVFQPLPQAQAEPLPFYPLKKNRDFNRSNSDNLKSYKNEILTKTILFSNSKKIHNSVFFTKEIKSPISDISYSPREQGKSKEIFTNFPEITNHRGSDFYRKRFRFYKNLDQLNIELMNLFLEKSLTYYENKFREVDSISYEFLKDDRLSEQLLEYLEKQALSKDFVGFRPMSGYLYPDVNTRDLKWFSNLRQIERRIFPFKKQHLLEQKNHDSKIKIPKSNVLSVTKNYPFTISNFPKILLEVRKFTIQNHEQNQTIYNGPSLVLDLKKGFDWKNIREKNLRSWFHEYLSPLNPLVQYRENFFGNYYSPQFSPHSNLLDFTEFKTNSFLRLKLTKDVSTKWTNFDWIYEYDSVQNLFLPFNSSIHFPCADASQSPSTILNSKSFLKEENLRGVSLTLPKIKGEHFFPLLQLKQPTFNNSKLGFEGYSSIFEFGVRGNPDVNSSFEIFKQNNFLIKYTSGQYKKLGSLFLKNQRPVAVDNWEPLTANSWLVISQLSFAVFTFQVLKSLADNYGRELLGYLLDLVAALGFLDDSVKQQIEILTGQRNKGFRVLLQSKKKFTDIVGIQKLLLEIYEIVLFLRNSARDFSLGKTLPHGILLTGPPGTGKTLLVQALAGEAQVPVIVLSGSSLIEPGESSAFKLQMVFQEARQLAPCIVFIDEIDTLSRKRTQLVQNPMAADQGFESFLESLILESKMEFQLSPKKSKLKFIHQDTENSENGKQEKIFNFSNSEQKEKQVSLLSQLLIELDGTQSRNGIVVIGATNRPEVLDPALLRPGRFDKIIQVGLPDTKKRVEILQFYGQNLGYQKNLPWNYLGERTAGFTAADLATLMNESTIKAILNQSFHTIQTIEHGINRLTTSESEKYIVFRTQRNLNKTEKTNSLTISSKLAILRLAYYQAGKIVLSYALETHPKSLVASLWPRRPTIRSVEITTNLQTSLFNFARLCEITDRLVGCYAGKAAEFLFLQKYSKHIFSKTSTLGLEDLVFAQNLVYFLLEDCRFYSKQTLIQETIRLAPNVNTREFYQNPEKIDLYSNFMGRIQIPPMAEALEAETSSLRSKKQQENDSLDLQEQAHYYIPWWQQEISDELEFKLKNSGNGSRLYLYNPERTQRNPEWFPPDEFYHGSSGLKTVKTAFTNIQRVRKQKQKSTVHQKLVLNEDNLIENRLNEEKQTIKLQKEQSSERKPRIQIPWNDLSKITRDYPSHSLILQSFNQALRILHENRELLDRIVIELLYEEVLRKPDIEILLKEFELKTIKSLQEEKDTETELEKRQEFQVLEFPWGQKSRKSLPKWINFVELKEETT